MSPSELTVLCKSPHFFFFFSTKLTFLLLGKELLIGEELYAKSNYLLPKGGASLDN